MPSTVPFDLAVPWGGRSQVLDLDVPVHWVDFGGPRDGASPPVVLVHGLGGSHLNWVHVASTLAEGRRVVALDLAGFGLTPTGTRTSSVHANAELLGGFVDEVVGEPAVLVGNSMGGMVSLLLAARAPRRVAGLALVDPSLPVPGQRPDPQIALGFALYAVPRVGELFLARLASRYTVRQRVLGTVGLCFADPSRVDAGVVLGEYRHALTGSDAEFLIAARSLLGVLRRPRRYDALIAGVDRPVLLVHGERDRFVPVVAARRTAARNPSWRTAYLEGVGHTPQLESPERLLEHLVPWLDGLADLARRAG